MDQDGRLVPDLAISAVRAPYCKVFLVARHYLNWQSK